MTRPRKAALAVGGASLLCIAAYVSLSYILCPAVMDSGGGYAVSSSYQLDCSIGGPVISTTAGGEATSTNYTLSANTMTVMSAPPAQPDGGGGGGGGGGCVPGATSTAGVIMAVLSALALARTRR